MESVYRPGLWPWLMQRVSGVLLVFGMAVHFLFLHFWVGVEGISFAMVRERLRTPFWTGFDLVLLLLVLYHALNGVLGIVIDYAPRPAVRRYAGAALLTLGILAYVAGIAALVGFAG